MRIKKIWHMKDTRREMKTAEEGRVSYAMEYNAVMVCYEKIKRKEFVDKFVSCFLFCFICMHGCTIA